MEELQTVNQLLLSNDFATVVDIHSAFSHILIAQDLIPFLSFTFQNQTYSYIALPFGINILRQSSLYGSELTQFKSQNFNCSEVTAGSGLDHIHGQIQIVTSAGFHIPRMDIQLEVNDNLMRFRTDKEITSEAANSNGWNSKTIIHKSALREINWWEQKLTQNFPTALIMRDPETILTMDASM
ncbi:MAG: hypothetical protein EZS28_010785 [Streblomastix strix]|uniref:Reverse transcriptase domain-containing protein n=1 Tax=Streblomastix strix TaxID=222440 RepID=A0A5J4WGM3_9EUKA|nr:MAG: hypothetical protein EZS28_010785 [Streblomastix strix]